MVRALRITLTVIAVILLLLAAGIFAATRLIDPNDFKPRLGELAREHAGLELHIPGELDWRFWPSLGVSVGRLETRLPEEQQLFAAVDEAGVGVAVWPLLFGEVRMDAIRVDGADVNLLRTAEGANWERLGPAQAAGEDGQKKADNPTTSTNETGSSLKGPISVPELSITNARVHYRDTTSGTDIQIRHIEFNARDATLGEAFPLALSLRYQDQADIRVDLDLEGEATLEPDSNHYRLAPLNITAEVGGLTAKPARVRLEQSLDVQLDRELARIEAFTLRTAGTRTRGNLEVRNWSAEPSFVGRLQTEPFDANAALEAVGIAPVETADPEALKRVAASADIKGNPGSLMAENLEIRVDDTTIAGRAGLADLDSGRLLADLELDEIRIDGYLPPVPEEPAGTEPATPAQGGSTQPRPLSTEALLPLDTLRGLDAQANLHLGRVAYQDLAVSEADFALTAGDGVIELTRASGRALDGSFELAARLDASGATPRLEAHQKLTEMQIRPAVQMALEKDLLKGVLSLDADLGATGNSEKALVDSAQGRAELRLNEATVRGVNLHKTLLQGLSDILGRYQGLTAYLPTQASGELPEELSEDTEFLDLHAKTRLDDRVAYLDSMQAQLRKGSLTGDGWFNLYNQDFDFNLGIRSPELGDSEYVAGRSWPIRCAGNLVGSAKDWCRPDSQGFREIGKEIAAAAARKRVRDELGVDAEGDTAEEVLKNAAKQKAREEAERKIKEEVEKQLDNQVEDKVRDKLRELFQ